jgi:hypothetical protein
VHRVSTKAGFVPEIDFGTFRFGLLCDGRNDVTLPDFFGLPGNPVAVMVTFQQFVRDALRILRAIDQFCPDPQGRMR